MTVLGAILCLAAAFVLIVMFFRGAMPPSAFDDDGRPRHDP